MTEYRCTTLEGYKEYIEASEPLEAAQIYMGRASHWEHGQEIFVESDMVQAIFIIEVEYTLEEE